MALAYDPNTKLINATDEESDDFLTNVEQINKLTKDLIAESNPNFTPKPNDQSTLMIKKLFENGLQHAKQQKFPEALKAINLAIEMAQRKRTPWEAFAIQLQELQFMLKNRIDLSLVTGKCMDALQDLDMLLNTGLAQPDVFIRKTDALLKLKQYEQAKAECERGLSFDPQNIKLKAMFMECSRKVAEYNGDI